MTNGKPSYIQDGRITETGTYRELLDQGREFADFLIQYIQQQEDSLEDSEAEVVSTVKQELEAKMGARQLQEEIRLGVLIFNLIF